ncbi:hypothetical protein GCM10010466_40110 [Planomonospora alba]|uniref:Uncharacterized protein n=1 Tax=Planomonospora alba TaxID=161354 RepID=A0ABP6NG23_9ACTN
MSIDAMAPDWGTANDWVPAIGYRSQVQSIPAWQANERIAVSSLPSLIAVSLTLPADFSFQTLHLGIGDNPNATGSWRAAVYDGKRGYVAGAVTYDVQATPWGGWWQVSFPHSVPASPDGNSVWVALELSKLQNVELPVLKPTPAAVGLLDGMCYGSTAHTELPAVINFVGWDKQPRIPVVALS